MGKGLSFEELMQLAELKKKEDEAAERIRAARIAANKEQEAEREREMKSRRGQASKVYAQNAKQKIEPFNVPRKKTPEIISKKAKPSAPVNLNQPVFVDRDHSTSALSHQRKSTIRLGGPAKIPKIEYSKPVAPASNSSQNVFKRSKSVEPPSRSRPSSSLFTGHKTVRSPPKSSASRQTKSRLGGGMKAGLVPLNQDKRDMRSMEEIQGDLRTKRAKLNGTYMEPVAEVTRPNTAAEKDRAMGMSVREKEQQLLIKRQADRKNAARQDDRNVARQDDRNGASISKYQQEPKRKYEIEDSQATASSSTYQQEPDMKRRRSSSAAPAPRRPRDEDMHDEEYVKGNLSSIIGGMFGYNRNRYQDDSDDSSDMEAGYDDVRKEEARSNRLGREEDRKEEARLDRLAKAKGKR